MSDFVPNPNGELPEDVPFDFSNLSAETVDAGGVDDVFPPDVKATKPKWWEAKRKTKAKAPKASEPKKRGRPPSSMSDSALRAALENFYAGIAMVAMPFCPHCAQSVGDNASDAADAMVEWAKTNPAVKRFLVNMVSISAGGKVLAVHSAMLMPVAMHHVPMLQRKQEEMVSQFAEQMTRAAAQQQQNGKESDES